MKTAVLTAAARAAESARPDRLFDDKFAFDAAGAEGAVLLSRAGGERTTAAVAVRTRWIDDRIYDAARRGVRRFVLVGAGFDARPSRLSIGGARFIAADRASVLLHRAQHASRESVQPIELASRGAVASLVSDEPTCFVIEGVLQYLAPVVALRLLGDLRPAPGSIVLFDAPTTAALTPTSADPTVRVLRELGAPLRFGIDDAAPLLHLVGLRARRLAHVGHPEAHYGRLADPPHARRDGAVETLLVEAEPVRAATEPDAAPSEEDVLAFFYASDGTPNVEDDLNVAGPVLDLGAGCGRLTIPLARRGVAVVAVDRSAAMLRELDDALALEDRSTRARVRTILADIAHADLGSGHRTALLADGVLSTIADPGRALRRVRDALEANGTVALTAVDRNSIDARGTPLRAEPLRRHLRTGAPYLRYLAADPMVADHQRIHGFYEVRAPVPRRLPFEYTLRLFTADSLAALLRESGFTRVAVQAERGMLRASAVRGG